MMRIPFSCDFGKNVPSDLLQRSLGQSCGGVARRKRTTGRGPPAAGNIIEVKCDANEQT
jgi:hypothetical protein